MGKAELAAVLGDHPAVLIVGSFDPLTVSHSERLAGFSHPPTMLIVAVTDPVNTVLSHTARMEMVAGVRVVDFVLPYEPGIEKAFLWTTIHNDTALHDRWTAEFKQHVRRHSQAAAV